MRRSGSSTWVAPAAPLPRGSDIPGRTETCPRCGGPTRHLGLRFGADGEVLEGGWCVQCRLYLRRRPEDLAWAIPRSDP